jgi:hypothetical protein
MKQRPQTFQEAAEELHKAGAELFHALFDPCQPFLEWLAEWLDRHIKWPERRK